MKKLRIEDGWVPGTPIPPNLYKLRSVNGGTSSLKAILDSRDPGDVDLKHGSQNSSAAQAFDVGPCVCSSKSFVGSKKNVLIESGASLPLKEVIERDSSIRTMIDNQEEEMYLRIHLKVS